VIGRQGTVQVEQESGMMRHGMSDSGQDNAPHYSGPLVIVKRFLDLPEALVAKSILDSAEVDSFLTDEDIIHLVYPNLISGVKLMVRPEDLETATALLNQADPEEDEEGDATDLPTILRRATHRDRSGENGK
jgi:hypothetical protein